MEILKSLVTITPAATQSLNPNVPRELSDLIDRLLAKNAKSRPESAAIVVRQLAEIARTSDVPMSEKFIGRKKHRFSSSYFAAAASAVCVMLAVIVITLKDQHGNVTRITVDAPEGTKIVDVVLVVGAPNSSNSDRLREIASECGVPSYVIEAAKALDPQGLERATSVGITAGASAPDTLVEELVERLRETTEIELEVLPGVTENVRFRMPQQLNDSPSRA